MNKYRIRYRVMFYGAIDIDASDDIKAGDLVEKMEHNNLINGDNGSWLEDIEIEILDSNQLEFE